MKKIVACYLVLVGAMFNASMHCHDVLFLQRVKGGTISNLSREFLVLLQEKFGVDTFIETGTFLGQTAELAADVFKEVHTIELSHDLVVNAEHKLKRYPHVRVYEGDSGVRLPEILQSVSPHAALWLDAHFSGGITTKGDTDTPILQELEAVAKSGIKSLVILVDDIRAFKPYTSCNDAISQDYPTLDTVFRMIKKINHEYQIVVYGDTLLAYVNPHIRPSHFIMGCTVSRLYNGENFTQEELAQAEKLIKNCGTQQEIDAIKWLVDWAPPTTGNAYYQYWVALASLGEIEKKIEVLKKNGCLFIGSL